MEESKSDNNRKMTERPMPSKHWKIQSQILCKEKRSRRKYARRKGPQVIHRQMGAGKGKGIARAPETGRCCHQPDIKEALSYMISVAVDALRLHLLREEVLGLGNIVLLLQRWTAVELGLCSTGQANKMESVWCPLLYPNELWSDQDTTCSLCHQQQAQRKAPR